MKLSEQYELKYTDRYAMFSYPSDSSHIGTYSEAGMELEHAEKYAEICKLEIAHEIWLAVWIQTKGKNEKLENTASESIKLCKIRLMEIAMEHKLKYESSPL